MGRSTISANDLRDVFGTFNPSSDMGNVKKRRNRQMGDRYRNSRLRCRKLIVNQEGGKSSCGYDSLAALSILVWTPEWGCSII
jgi:hypothetical protein